MSQKDDWDYGYEVGWEEGYEQMQQEFQHLESQVLRLEAENRVLKNELSKKDTNKKV